MSVTCWNSQTLQSLLGYNLPPLHTKTYTWYTEWRVTKKSRSHVKKFIFPKILYVYIYIYACVKASFWLFVCFRTISLGHSELTESLTPGSLSWGLGEVRTIRPPGGFFWFFWKGKAYWRNRLKRIDVLTYWAGGRAYRVSRIALSISPLWIWSAKIRKTKRKIHSGERVTGVSRNDSFFLSFFSFCIPMTHSPLWIWSAEILFQNFQIFHNILLNLANFSWRPMKRDLEW